MTETELPKFPAELVPGFKVTLQGDQGTWLLVCSGSLDVPDAASKVQPELLRLHDAAVSSKVKQVKLDMHDVDYMNSSGIKSFVAWFLKAEWSKDHRYTIELVYDPDRNWQSVSFSAVERLVPKVLRVKSMTRA